MWDEITNPFPNFNGYTVEIWEWINKFIPHFTVHVITYPYGDLSQSMLVKETLDFTLEWIATASHVRLSFRILFESGVWEGTISNIKAFPLFLN